MRNVFFCYNPYRDSPINYEQIDSIVQSVSKSKIPHVYLIGGEPSLLNIERLNDYIQKLSKNSSVTIVTNGLKYMEDLSNDLACLGVAIHGDAETQEWLSGIEGGYSKTVANIEKYVANGFDVRCIPVLTSKNYEQIYDIIKLAKGLGMESVFVDKFEIGGMGLDMANQLKPSLEEFKISLKQMIKARDDFNIPVGFGTAIPYCLDEKLIEEDMFANCGVGVTFGAVNPDGDFRICNQSEIVYGNVLEEPIEKIWNKKSLNEFRDLSWTDSPCDDCILVTECTGGCKVDLSCSPTYCIDYHIRENRDDLVSVDKVEKLWKKREKLLEKRSTEISVPTYYRKYKVDDYTKINDKHKEKYVVTRYQTVVVEDFVFTVLKSLIDGCLSESELIKKFQNDIEEKDLRELLTNLETIGAIHSEKITSVDWEITKDCNLECAHCITSSPIVQNQSSLGEKIRVINSLCDNGLQEVSITGGEPLSLPHIKELLRYLKQKNIRTNLLTNGTLLTKNLVLELKDLVSEIGVSIDGVDEESNDYIRGEGTFGKIMKSIELLKSYDIKFSLYFTIHKKNKDIEEMINFSKDIGAEYCRINEITKRGRASLDKDKKFESGVQVSSKLKDFSNKCDLSDSSIFIDPIGRCYPCVELSQRGIKEIGNIYEDSISEIHQNLKDFNNENKGKDCPYTIVVGDYETVCLNNKLKCIVK